MPTAPAPYFPSAAMAIGPGRLRASTTDLRQTSSVVSLRLPQNRDKNYLGDYYAACPRRYVTSTRSIWAGFDGNPIKLHRPSRREEAVHMAELAGGLVCSTAWAATISVKPNPNPAVPLAAIAEIESGSPTPSTEALCGV